MTINSTDYFEGLRDNANAFRTHAGDIFNDRDLQSHRRRKNTSHKRQRRPAEQYPLEQYPVAEQYERSALPPPQIDHLAMLNDAPYHDALVAYQNLQRLEESFSKSRQSPSMNDNRSYNDDHTNHRNNGATFSSPVLGGNTAPDATAMQDHQAASQPDAWHGTSNVEALLLRELEELDKQLDIIRSPDKELRSPSSATHTPMAEQENKDWEEYSDDEGYVYYYNPVTGESQWDEPTIGSPDQTVKESKGSGGGDETGSGDDKDNNEGSGGSPKGLTKAQQKLWMMTLNPRQQDLFYQTLHPELHQATQAKGDTNQENSNDDVDS